MVCHKHFQLKFKKELKRRIETKSIITANKLKFIITCGNKCIYVRLYICIRANALIISRMESNLKNKKLEVICNYTDTPVYVANRV